MNRIYTYTLLLLFGLLCGICHAGGTPITVSDSIAAVVQDCERPDRAVWQKPEKVVERLMIKPGSFIADIGSGSGYFSVLFAKASGAHGRVYAVDNDHEMVAYLEKRIAKEGYGTIKPVLSKPDDPMLPKAAVDLAFICNTYMFIDNREQYLMRLKDGLKKDGRLAIVSYNDGDIPDAPPVHKRVSREKTIQEAQQAGFVLDAEYFFLPYQHFLLFVKGR